MLNTHPGRKHGALDGADRLMFNSNAKWWRIEWTPHALGPWAACQTRSKPAGISRWTSTALAPIAWTA